MIYFNKVSITDIEKNLILESLESGKLSGDGPFTKKVSALMNDKFGIKNFLLTTSCSSALDMAAILIDLKKGDEVIVPSYTFVSTANSIILRNATPVFCDVDSVYMNMDVNKIEQLITKKTKAIFVVHYAGVVCDMDVICNLAKKYNLYVIEDAAQAVGVTYKGRYAGTIGDFGCYSFHETKNYSMGEGGALIVNNEKFLERAEIIREKGTNRKQFLRGQVDKYTWQDMGSSFLPSDLLAAMLYGQMIRFDEIMNKRLYIWEKYYKAFEELEQKGYLIRQKENENSTNNAHMFFLILKNINERTDFINYLKENEIAAVFHYVPLHNSPWAIKSIGQLNLPITEEYADRLVRLPLYADMEETDLQYIIKTVKEYFIREK